ncbi:hypothetical protein C5167_003466 [Papaver somniferum]|uniref:Uncharacterized protein n=1 Tax=Papaver somniferum TaxID=3469 RepID=A0A4Y7L3P3_PAPSO|nr:hypothetical protein C5167_003466 [Papaver somniferum]
MSVQKKAKHHQQNLFKLETPYILFRLTFSICGIWAYKILSRIHSLHQNHGYDKSTSCPNQKFSKIYKKTPNHEAFTICYELVIHEAYHEVATHEVIQGVAYREVLTFTWVLTYSS